MNAVCEHINVLSENRNDIKIGPEIGIYFPNLGTIKLQKFCYE